MGAPVALLRRLSAALRTPPRWSHFGPFAREAAWLLPVLLALGFAGGLMRLAPRFDEAVLRLALIALVAPALAEELLFRAALLPRPDPDRPLPLGALALSASLFLLWHPLQILIFPPHWRAVMLDPWFLAAVAAFGIASARLYWATGSIWPSVALHWLVVVAWKALLSGPSPWLET